jgi:hypothetical protein
MVAKFNSAEDALNSRAMYSLLDDLREQQKEDTAARGKLKLRQSSRQSTFDRWDELDQRIRRRRRQIHALLYVMMGTDDE